MVIDEPGVCPRCNEANLDYAANETVDDMLKYPYVCEDCGFEGLEWYSVVFSSHTDTEGNEQ